ncbi:hypothetical protein PGT21_002200 [Puccinia graminis f. sp. tritici]|uniref:Uncharacterized protein n=1 Tax=Puccinia graminis f. sp. tritici TaxID=56615 RepID=A0A5B0LMV8_PUCGR|nr:hypothetical protein PGT21_002200 [Puccinia graminis f. sp. tritici]
MAPVSEDTPPAPMQTGQARAICTPAASTKSTEQDLDPHRESANNPHTPSPTLCKNDFFSLPNPIGTPWTTCPTFVCFPRWNRESIEQNFAQSNPLPRPAELPPAPGLNTAPPSTLFTSAPAPSLRPHPQNPVIHEPTSRPSKYRFATVQLKGMDDDVVGKRAHLKSRGSDEDADGSTNYSDDELDEPPAQQPVPVGLYHPSGATKGD